MSIRYLYNSKGKYVCFILNSNVFLHDGTWIGIVDEQNRFFSADGSYVGFISNDDRIFKDNRAGLKFRISRPSRPPRVSRPMRPLNRLAMLRPPYPYSDYFETQPQIQAESNSSDFSYLWGSKIFAEDGTFLGNISNNRFDSDSLLNRFGSFGNRFSSCSLLNRYCPYGNPYSVLSPFNRFTTTPPKIVKDGQIIRFLSKNPYVSNAIDPDEFLNWLEAQS